MYFKKTQQRKKKHPVERFAHTVRDNKDTITSHLWSANRNKRPQPDDLVVLIKHRASFSVFGNPHEALYKLSITFSLYKISVSVFLVFKHFMA